MSEVFNRRQMLTLVGLALIVDSMIYFVTGYEMF